MLGCFPDPGVSWTPQMNSAEANMYCGLQMGALGLNTSIDTNKMITMSYSEVLVGAGGYCCVDTTNNDWTYLPETLTYGLS